MRRVLKCAFAYDLSLTVLRLTLCGLKDIIIPLLTPTACCCALHVVSVSDIVTLPVVMTMPDVVPLPVVPVVVALPVVVPDMVPLSVLCPYLLLFPCLTL